MPTLCMDGVGRVPAVRRRTARKFFNWCNLSQPVSSTLPTAELPILFVILVRDQEAGGSNPLATAKLLNRLLVGATNTVDGGPTRGDVVRPFQERVARLVEESEEEYYRFLKLCSQGWHEGENEIVPWWNHYLGLLRNAYQEFQRQVESVGARPAKSDLVRQTVLAQVDRFTLSDVAAVLPAASPQLIKKVLAEMKKTCKVRLVGRGRGAWWEVIR